MLYLKCRLKRVIKKASKTCCFFLLNGSSIRKILLCHQKTNHFDCRFKPMSYSFLKTFTAIAKEKTDQNSCCSNLQKWTYLISQNVSIGASGFHKSMLSNWWRTSKAYIQNRTASHLKAEIDKSLKNGQRNRCNHKSITLLKKIKDRKSILYSRTRLCC